MADEAEARPAVLFASILGAALWRHRWLIAVSTVLAGVAGFFLSSLQPEAWTAQSRLVLSTTQNFNPLGTPGGAVAPDRFISNQMSIIQSEPVLGLAADILDDGTSSGALGETLAVSAPADSDIIEITAEGPTAALAAARADAVAQAYQQFRLTSVQEAADRAAEAVVADPLRVADVRTQAAVYGDGVGVVENASEPSAPVSPRPRRDAVLLALLAAFVTAGIALWRRDGQKQHDGETLAEQMGAPLLGVVRVPAVRGEFVRPGPEGFDMALVALDYTQAGHPGPVLVTGLERESGAAALVLGLAGAAARNRRVLVVDADAQNRSLLRLSGAAEPAVQIDHHAPGQPSSALVSVVPPLVGGGPAIFDVAVLGRGLLGRSADVDRARRTFGLLNGEYDLVLVHADPLAADAVAFSLLREVGTVVVVGGGTGRYEPDAFVPATRHVLSLAGRSCDGLVLTTPVKVRRGREPVVEPAAGTPQPQPAVGGSKPR